MARSSLRPNGKPMLALRTIVDSPAPLSEAEVYLEVRSKRLTTMGAAMETDFYAALMVLRRRGLIEAAGKQSGVNRYKATDAGIRYTAPR